MNNCDYPNCTAEAKHQGYFNLLEKPGDPLNKSKPHWKLCPEHSTITLKTVIELNAMDYIIQLFGEPGQENAKLDFSSYTTEPL